MLGGKEFLCDSCKHKMSDLRFASNCGLVNVSPSALKVMVLSWDISRAEG